MAILKWDAASQRKVETGVSKGVLYVRGEPGVAWNGLTSVTETLTGGDLVDLYADNDAYGMMQSLLGFEATIEAYTYPDEYSLCDGSALLAKGIKAGRQRRRYFDFCYRTEIYSDSGVNIGYKLHLIYNAISSPSELSYKTIGDSIDTSVFSWTIKSLPLHLNDHLATPIITVDSTEVDLKNLRQLESILYGTQNDDPRMPNPDEVAFLIQKVDLLNSFVEILSMSGLWKWDTFNFKTDTVPDAIAREAENRVYFNPSKGTVYPIPAIAYSLLSDEEASPREYMIVVVDSENPSKYVTELKNSFDLYGEEVTKIGDTYYYVYNLEL